MNSYILVPVVLYTAWAIYSGYKYVNGRYPWLEQPEIAHRICKYAAILGMGYYSDYEKAYLQIKSGTQISFSSGNARLEYSDGEVKSSNNVSGPYSLRSDGDNDDGEIEFCIEKQQLGKDGFCSVSNDAGGNELTIINDGWSVSIVSDKPIQISMFLATETFSHLKKHFFPNST